MVLFRNFVFQQRLKLKQTEKTEPLQEERRRYEKAKHTITKQVGTFLMLLFESYAHY